MKELKGSIIKSLIAMALFIALSFAIEINIQKQISVNSEILASNWNVTVNDKEYTNQNLSIFHIGKIQKDDIVTISRNIADTDTHQNLVLFRPRYSAVMVYLDDSLIYEYGMDYYEKGQVLGNGYCWFEIPKYTGEKTIRFEFYAAEDGAFTNLTQVQIMQASDLYRWFIINNLVTIIILCFFILLGFLMLLGALLVEKQKSVSKRMLWLGVFCIQVTGWIGCSNKTIQIFIDDLHTTCEIEYILMYSSFFTLMLGTTLFLKSPRRIKQVKFMSAGLLALEAMLVCLNQFNIVHFPKTGWIFQITAMIVLVIVAFMMGKMIKTARGDSEKIFLSGIVCSAINIILELFRYRYNKIVVPAYEIGQSFIPIGVLIFVLAIFGSFLSKVMENFTENVEKKTLYNMAYTDVLTGIHNRAWCEKFMDDYDSQKKPHTIINIDLNKFKEVNDNLGHAVGDRLLQDFAHMLDLVFGKEGCVGRLGGDEFIVILDYMPDESIETLMNKLENMISEFNEEQEQVYTIDFSYGYASSLNGAVNIHETYNIADAHMYQNKRAR